MSATAFDLASLDLDAIARRHDQARTQRIVMFSVTAILALAISGWHAPLFIMSEFSAHPIGFVTTVAVTFWYAWLFNRASGSSLLTLIAHGVEGGVLVSSFWSGGPDLERLNWTYAISWCLVAFVLLLVDRRYWVGRSSEAITPRPADRVESAATTAGGAVT
jgi:hypothetical protein